MSNIVYKGANNRDGVYELFPSQGEETEHIIIFMHGYKGYKDWGAWSLMLKSIANEGHTVYSLNFSHNGGTVEDPIDFPDLEAFGNNRFTYEIFDTNAMIEIVAKDHPNKKIHLFAHSRGGAIAVLEGAKNDKITSVFTLASVCDLKERFATGKWLQMWKDDGVQYMMNSRTLQKMPHYISFYDDFVENEAVLTISEQLKGNVKPMYHIHGTKDTTVLVNDANRLQNFTGGEIHLIEEANHTFGQIHPWIKKEMPADLKKVADYVKLKLN
jgi:pimeloyl-ACP methyl ester carboxylesterase